MATNIAIFRINYKSDFILTLNSDAGWMTPFCIKFWTGAPSQAYFAGFDGTTYTHCAPVDGEPTKLRVQFDDHHLPIGDLKFQIAYHFTVADFPTSVEDEVLNQASVIIEVDDAPTQVMLDLNGETAPEIQFSLPAYTNEVQRIANEEQRIENEQQRVEAEQTRQLNEQTRVNQETARVNEYAELKADAVAATKDANDAAVLATQKAGLADDAATLAAQKAGLANDAAVLATQKAGMADDAATLATQKAGLANDAAALATQKAGLANDAATLANQKAQYAQDQGDYAKAQGDYAKAQANVIPADVTRSQTDATFVNGNHDPLFYLRQANSSHAGLMTAAGYTKLNDMPSAQEVNAGLAYDVSVLHPTSGVNGGSTYASLSAALAVIPQDKRKGGMTVKFIQSSDNKYVQYRLMTQDFSTYDGDWIASPSKVPKEEVIQSTEQAIEFQTNSGSVVGKITETESDFNNLKTGGKSVATQEALNAGLAEKQHTLTAGAGIKITNNVISAEEIKEVVEVQSVEEEQRWEDDSNNADIYAKINKNGVYAKKYFDIEGRELEILSKTQSLKKEVCNTNYNTVSLSPFIKKYINKECDNWNQLNIAMCGDSIFGIQINPGMALTPDCNDESEEEAGYITGHFPPNMWVQGVGYKLLKEMQYDSADVKYYNHVASEVTKTGTWTDLFNSSSNLDKIRVVKSETSGDTISLAFSNAVYAKLIISDYIVDISETTIKVTISENGGEYVTPASLGLIESHSFAEGHSGEYALADLNSLKFSQIVFKGFNASKSYVIKVEHTDTHNLVVWGFETWTRERLNVIVTAQGANIAGNQYNAPQRFYNENTNADLCIINAPFLNDFSTSGWQTWYKGKITLSSTTPTSPAQYNFYYCDESGVYTNFGGIKASVGDYIEWSGTEWVLGSTKLNALFNAYNDKFPAMLDMCKKIGIPMLIIATHTADLFIGKPFIDTAVKLMRLYIENYQYPCIDVYKYREELGLTNIWVDGVHLNDIGIAMYMNLISEVLNKNCPVAHACESWKCGNFYGHSDGGDVTFRYVAYPSNRYLELKNLPKVYILNNPNITITNISKHGFSVSGSGEFDYHVISN